MAKYVLQTRKSDTLAVTMAAGASSCTLSTGAFGSPATNQIITIDYDNSAKAADFDCAIAGTAVTSMTRLNGPDVEHSATAKVAMCFVDEHYGTNGTPDIAWIDHSPTFTGFSADPSGYTSKYIQLGKTVIWRYHSNTRGTSNAVTLTMTLPIAATNGIAQIPCLVSDSGTWQAGFAVINASGLTLDFGKGAVGQGNFTNSGEKDVIFEIIYQCV